MFLLSPRSSVVRLAGKFSSTLLGVLELYKYSLCGYGNLDGIPIPPVALDAGLKLDTCTSVIL